MFITFEGIEGSGKTTQIRWASEHLSDRGRAPVVTRQPGGTGIGTEIRRILLDPDNGDIAPLTEMLLYLADRAQHIAEVIRPALDSGRIVLCDRYADATTVYQGAARGLGADMADTLHGLLFGGLTPDRTVLLDLPPETGLRRAWQQIGDGTRAAAETRFEKEALGFHEKIRTGYLALARRWPDRFAVVDADRPAEQVRADIIAMIDGMLEDG